jgi:hypothetical protein
LLKGRVGKVSRRKIRVVCTLQFIMNSMTTNNEVTPQGETRRAHHRIVYQLAWIPKDHRPILVSAVQETTRRFSEEACTRQDLCRGRRFCCQSLP